MSDLVQDVFSKERLEHDVRLFTEASRRARASGRYSTTEAPGWMACVRWMEERAAIARERLAILGHNTWDVLPPKDAA